MKHKHLYLIASSISLLSFIMVAVIILTQPNQFDAEINDTVGKIPDNTFNLIIYTDIHHDPSYEIDPWRETLDCISAVSEKAHINAFWNLGDIINGRTTTKAEAIAQIREIMERENGISSDFHRIPGNHDNNIESTFDSTVSMDEVLSPAELKAVLENKHTSQTEHHSTTRPTDYYVDIDQLRVVCLTADGATFLSETAEWLRNTALNTDLPVLVLSHIPTRPEWGFHEDVVGGDLIETELKSFIDSGGTIIAFVHGHDHGDMINQVFTDDGEVLWNEIAVACSRFHVPTSNGTPGMMFWERNENDATMVIFDVVSIDLEEKTVRFIRFGAGEDREIKY